MRNVERGRDRAALDPQCLRDRRVVEVGVVAQENCETLSLGQCGNRGAQIRIPGWMAVASNDRDRRCCLGLAP
jgi:hypothetical protein